MGGEPSVGAFLDGHAGELDIERRPKSVGQRSLVDGLCELCELCI